MSSTGMTTSISSGLGDPGVDDGDVARRARRRPAAEEAGDLGERALRGRQADALRRPSRDLLEPLQRDGEVGAALGGGEGVDLVDDDRLDVGERVGGVRRQHQVEALGRRDQQVGRAAQQRLAVLRRRVAGAHRDLGQDERHGGRVGRRSLAASRSAARAMPASGARRFFSTSKARARSGEM